MTILEVHRKAVEIWFERNPDAGKIPNREEVAAIRNELYSMWEAQAEYARHRIEKEEDECPHDELDHGVCLDCGKDCFDDMIAAVEFRVDCLEDR